MTIEGLPPDEGEALEPFVEALESCCGEFGPVVGGGTREAGQVVLSADAADRAELARTAVACVTDALHQAGLGDLYPTGIEIEDAEDREPVAA